MTSQARVDQSERQLEQTLTGQAFEAMGRVQTQVLRDQHEPIAGTGVVIGVLRNTWRTDVTDANGFEQWTMELPKLSVGERWTPAGDGKSLFSAGGFVWVRTTGGLFSPSIVGQVEVTHLSPQIATAEINLSTTAWDVTRTSYTRSFAASGMLQLERLSDVGDYRQWLMKCLRR